ncbi:MAG: hypothetical protein WBB73_12110 [Candidatus Aminicenantaceae bacterium]
MAEFELLTHMERVEAPLGFEGRVMTRLAERKRLRRRARRLGFSLATVAASLAVVVMAVNFLVLPQGGPGEMASLEKDIPVEFQPRNLSSTIPITEVLDYSGEARQVTRQPRTIYILEQVSDRTDTRKIY